MVHQLNLTSAIVFKNESTVYMADTFEQGNSMRSFRIVGAHSDQNQLNVRSFTNALQVFWDRLQYCESHKETYADIDTYFYGDGAIKFNIFRVHNQNDNCNMTIVFADGHYEGSKDGNGTIVDEKVIFKKVIPGSNISNSIYFIFTPRTTCQEHITEDACIIKTRGKPECKWCPKCQKCLGKESPCSCLAQTETTEFQPLKIGSSNIYSIGGIVSACILIGLFIVGRMVYRYKLFHHQFNCQPCMT
uniref:SJCHGC03091 protein n=1 Tax=Schistosoma japonicum TaxID=6182 RepID=Q5DHU4_SCHJA|nr:SJCHGC03091 protein [Schistosoma japonicum]